MIATNTEAYDSVVSVSYAVATSLEKDRLFFDGLEANLLWSTAMDTVIGKTPAFSFYSTDKTRLTNSYLHFFKTMDGVQYRCVIPVTSLRKASHVVDEAITASNVLYDEPYGVFGYEWELYPDTVEYELV